MLGYTSVMKISRESIGAGHGAGHQGKTHTKSWEDEQVDLPKEFLLKLFINSWCQSRGGGIALQSQLRRLLRRR